jgi:hypothetical protein
MPQLSVQGYQYRVHDILCLVTRRTEDAIPGSCSQSQALSLPRSSLVSQCRHVASMHWAGRPDHGESEERKQMGKRPHGFAAVSPSSSRPSALSTNARKTRSPSPSPSEVPDTGNAALLTTARNAPAERRIACHELTARTVV